MTLNQLVNVYYPHIQGSYEMSRSSPHELYFLYGVYTVSDIPWAPKTYMLRGFYGKQSGFLVAKTLIVHGFGGSWYIIYTPLKLNSDPKHCHILEELPVPNDDFAYPSEKLSGSIYMKTWFLQYYQKGFPKFPKANCPSHAIQFAPVDRVCKDEHV